MKRIFLVILFSLPIILFGQGNLELEVFDYVYGDEKGNFYSEKDYADIGAIGCYDKLQISTNGNITTFVFRLRKDYIKWSETNTQEVYSYLVIENYIEEDTEYWILERQDGARLVFDYHKDYEIYTLTIPVNEIEGAVYIYVFTKS